jgi:hypothetical protein
VQVHCRKYSFWLIFNAFIDPTGQCHGEAIAFYPHCDAIKIASGLPDQIAFLSHHQNSHDLPMMTTRREAGPAMDSPVGPTAADASADAQALVLSASGRRNLHCGMHQNGAIGVTTAVTQHKGLLPHPEVLCQF